MSLVSEPHPPAPAARAPPSPASEGGVSTPPPRTPSPACGGGLGWGLAPDLTITADRLLAEIIALAGFRDQHRDRELGGLDGGGDIVRGGGARRHLQAMMMR